MGAPPKSEEAVVTSSSNVDLAFKRQTSFSIGATLRGGQA